MNRAHLGTDPSATLCTCGLAAEAKIAQESSRALARVQPDRELRVNLGNGDTVPLPKAAARLLTYLLTEMGEGNAVTLIPIHAELTTQEAADYLRVSRPYLIGLLEKGAVRHHKVGTHRRVVFADLKRFKEITMGHHIIAGRKTYESIGKPLPGRQKP